VEPENEQVPETLPPEVRMREELQLTVRVPGPEMDFEIDIDPANPLSDGGLPRLVAVTETPADFPALKVRLVVFVARANPLTLMAIVTEFLTSRPVALSALW